MITDIYIPDYVRKIITAFEGAGHEACAVGGCVRDALLGREPQDWDIATSARPEQTKEIFRRTIDTGIKHGTVTVLMDGQACEVTTYRVDGPYEDGRHPKQVSFTPSLKEDLARRDFTINAMAYSPALGLTDLFGGLEDLERGIVRCVGEPRERFGEDALRIMRAVRFSAQLGFDIDHDTEAACAALAPTLKNISAERVREEMTKLLVSDEPGKVRKLYELGITKEIFPEFDVMKATEQDGRYHCADVGEHTVRVVENVRPTALMRWTALLHDVGKPACRTVDPVTGAIHFKGHGPAGAGMAKDILRRFKFDNATIDAASKLIAWHTSFKHYDEYRLRQTVCAIGPELYELLLELKRADSRGKKPEFIESGVARFDAIEETFRTIMERGDCCSLDRLAVNGSDLIACGVAPGPEVGRTLRAMLDDVLREPSHNEREYLLSRFVR